MVRTRRSSEVISRIREAKSRKEVYYTEKSYSAPPRMRLSCRLSDGRVICTVIFTRYIFILKVDPPLTVPQQRWLVS
jgi:hypothetical protein